MELELEFLNLFILLICLYIIQDIAKQLKESGQKSTKAILFLQSTTFVSGLRIIIFAITLWAIKDGLFILDESIHLGISDVLRGFGVLTSIILSYGLYLVLVPFRKIHKE